MGKKRKQDQDSSSSDAKRKRCRSCYCQSGDTSRPNDEMQDKLRMEEKNKRKIQKLKEKMKKDQTKHEKDLRLLKEDLIRIFKKDHEELKSKIQEIQKEVCAEVRHYKAYPSQRSQLLQSTRFRLVIENSVKSTIYKNRTVQTEDGGGHIKVVMYDGDYPIAPDHDLASVKVELVLIEGVFDEKRDSWSKEEFKESIILPPKTTRLTSLVKNGTFDLSDGRCDYKGAIIMDNSKKKEVKLGVRMAVHTKIRVLEGVSNPFKVQEGKTEKSVLNKKGNKPSPVRTRNLVEPTNTHAVQHGQGPVSTDEQHSLPPPVNQGILQKADRGNHAEFLTDGAIEGCRPATVPVIVEGHGQALNGNGQHSCRHIPKQISCLPTSTHSMKHGGQHNSLPSTSIQNPLQAAANTYCLVNQCLLACEQDQYTTRIPDGSSQLAFQDHSAYALINDTYQGNSITRGEMSVEGVQPPNVQLSIQDYFIFPHSGQALNGNSQQSCELIPMQISWPPTSTHSMQHGQNYDLPSTSNQSLMQAAGYSLVDQPLLACGPDQYTSFPNLSVDPLLDDDLQWPSMEGERSGEDVHPSNIQTQVQGCHEHDTGMRYTCPQPDCALTKLEETLVHPLLNSTKFELHLEVPENEARLCGACGTKVLDFHYHCSRTGMDLHPSCAKLPLQIWLEKLTFELRERVSQRCTMCKGGGGVRDFWFYRSTCKTVCMHVRCPRPESDVHDNNNSLVSFVKETALHPGSDLEHTYQIIKTVVRIITSVISGGPITSAISEELPGIIGSRS